MKGDYKKEHEILDAQCKQWKKAYSEEPEFFGEKPSYPARKAVEIFKKEGKTKILELGGGQGRDTLYFAFGMNETLLIS